MSPTVWTITYADTLKTTYIYMYIHNINLGPKTRCTDNSDTDIHTVGSWPSHFLDLDPNTNTLNCLILAFTDISDPDLHRYFAPWPSHRHFGSLFSRTPKFGPWQKHFRPWPLKPIEPWPLHTFWPNTFRDTGLRSLQTIWTQISTHNLEHDTHRPFLTLTLRDIMNPDPQRHWSMTLTQTLLIMTSQTFWTLTLTDTLNIA